jgi:nucleoid-associated protein YgaU
VTRELKLALIVGFTLVLVVTVLISDHLSKARQTKLDTGNAQLTVAPAQWPREVGGTTPSASGMMNPLPGPLAQIPESKPVEPAPAELRIADSSPRDPSPEPLVSRSNDNASTEPVPELRLGRSNDPLVREIKARGGTIDDSGAFKLPVTARVDRTPTGEAIPAPTPKAIPAPTPGEQSYTIAPGDSVTKIAAKFYGDGKHWRKLAEFNPGRIGANGEVRAGQAIRVPTAEVLLGKAAPKSISPTKPSQAKLAKSDPNTSADKKPADKKLPDPPKPSKTYVVQKGDSLGTIAQKTLGSSKKLGELLAANSDVIDDEDNVPAGTVLKIPGK